MSETSEKRATRWAITAPPTLFLLAFFLVPALIVVLASFQYPGEFGGLAPLFDAGDGSEHGLTLENYQFFASDFLFTEIFLRSFAVAAAARSLTVRLKSEDGRLLGEQSLPASFCNDGRFMLKIEMEGKQAVPRFTLTQMRAR